MAEFKRSASGNVIVKDFGYVKRKIGDIYSCSAITIYKQQSDKMVLIYAGGKVTFRDFDMTDDSSFVVITQKGTGHKIFFREDNKKLYVCLKASGFILTFHFPCGNEWNSELFFDFRTNVENGIMIKNGDLFEMAISILEGVI